MSLSWEKEGSVKPIAKVKAPGNEDWHGKILYISSKAPAKLTNGETAFNLLGLDYFKKGRVGRMITKEDIGWIKNELTKALGGKIQPKKRKLEEMEQPPTMMPRDKRQMLDKLIDQALIDVKKLHGRSVTLPPDCNFIPVCNTIQEQRDCIFIFGPSGSGKSVFCKIYGLQWKRQHPDGQIFLISQKKKDKNLDALDLTQIELDEGFLKDPPDLSEIAHSLVIFDGKLSFMCLFIHSVSDYGAIDDPAIKKAVKSFQDKLLHLSRQDGVDLLITTHVFLCSDCCDSWVFIGRFKLASDKKYPG